MISKFITVPLLIAAGVVAHPAIVRRDIPTLSQWQDSGLEPFWTYRVRYQSLDCADQTGSDFYNSCCYPLQAGQSASAECTPATLSCSSSGPFGTTTTVTTPAVSTPSDTGATTQSNDDNNTSYNQGSTDTSNTDNSGSTDNSGYTDNSSSTDNNSGSTDNSGNTGSTNNNSGGGSGDINYGGHGTYYYQGGNAGACGTVHGDYDFIGAIDQAWYGDLGAQSQYCGRNVQITNTDNGKSITIVVADVCPTCDNNNSFDLSVGAFSALADLSQGLINIQWQFV